MRRVTRRSMFSTVPSKSFVRIWSPLRNGRRTNSTRPAMKFSRIDWTAKASARPASPSPASAGPTRTPAIDSASSATATIAAMRTMRTMKSRTTGSRVTRPSARRARWVASSATAMPRISTTTAMPTRGRLDTMSR